jgi:stearoyl-CoA desaturase (delta-9 desaturase)
MDTWTTFIYGPFNPPWWIYLLYTFVMTQITIMTVTVYYHRAMAHRALFLHPKLILFFRFWGALTTGMIPWEWVMIHRYHHSKDDALGDPHSPRIFGIWQVLFLGVVLYYKAARNREIIRKSKPKDIKPDWFDEHLFENPGRFGRFYGVGIMLIIDLALFGLIGALIWLVQMLWIPFWAAGVINGIGHWPRFLGFIGYRNFEIKEIVPPEQRAHKEFDQSSNITPLGIWIGGEELHNNHHAFPKSAKLSYHPWEFDIGWMYIRLFEMMGWAKAKFIHDKKVYDESNLPNWAH